MSVWPDAQFGRSQAQDEKHNKVDAGPGRNADREPANSFHKGGADPPGQRPLELVDRNPHYDDRDEHLGHQS